MEERQFTVEDYVCYKINIPRELYISRLPSTGINQSTIKENLNVLME